MKIKRITIEVEVPVQTITGQELLSLIRGYLNQQTTPHQEQVTCELSPNILIGNVTK